MPDRTTAPSDPRARRIVIWSIVALAVGLELTVVASSGRSTISTAMRLGFLACLTGKWWSRQNRPEVDTWFVLALLALVAFGSAGPAGTCADPGGAWGEP